VFYKKEIDALLEERSRLLYVHAYSLKDTVHDDLSTRYKDHSLIVDKEEDWKMFFMAASISTALFSSVLVGNRDFPRIYAYQKLKINEHFIEGEAAIEDCMGFISDLTKGSEYNPERFSETLAMWLYFKVKGTMDEFVSEETTPFMLIGQFITNYFFDWFDKNH
jgi:hypothetical protein